jgi:predicted glutamine amidotransferase
MHNGDLKNFNNYKKKVIDEIDDKLYELINGNTDSEHVFYLVLTYLKDKKFTQKNVKEAILKTINFINNASNNIFSFNIAITNSKLIVFTRYINNDQKPPSLYFCRKNNNIKISSEPIDYSDEWTYIPKNMMGYYIKNKLSFNKI